MKSTTPQNVFARSGDPGGVFAVAAVASALPSAKEQPKSDRTQLVVRDESGAIAQRWSMQQAKCTIGSSERSNIQVELPGIEPLNALMIQGARQAFVRALVPNLSQDGVMVNELLLTDHKNYFELAGHRFELLRQSQNASPKLPAKSRIQFSAARPFDLSSHTASTRYARAADRELPTELADSPWLKSLIERTFEPLEAQIESLLLPVNEYQTQVLESHKAREAESLVEQQKQAELAKEISTIVAKQSATMETLSERLRDVNQQLSAIERIIAEDSELESKAKDCMSQEVNIQRTAIEQLQSGMVAVTESLNHLHDHQLAGQAEQYQWKEAVQQQLNDLSQVVRDIQKQTSHRTDGEVLESVHSLQQGQQLVQEELQRLQYGLNEHLENLEKRVSELTDISELLQSLPGPAEKQIMETAPLLGQGAVPRAQAVQPELVEPSQEPGVLEISSGWELGLAELPSQEDFWRESPNRVQLKLENVDWLDQWTTIPIHEQSTASELHNEPDCMPEIIEPTDLDAHPDPVNEYVGFDDVETSLATHSGDYSPVAAGPGQGEVGRTDEDSSDACGWSDAPRTSWTDHASPNVLFNESPDESSALASPLTQALDRSQWASERNEWNPETLQPERKTRASDGESEFFFGAETFKAELRNVPNTILEKTVQDIANAQEEDNRLPTANGAIESYLPSWWIDESGEQQADQSDKLDQLDSTSQPQQPEEWSDDVRHADTDDLQELPDAGSANSSVLDSQVKDLSQFLDSFKENRTEIAVRPTGDHEETSVEDYMKSLLARMRGEPDSVVERPAQDQPSKSNLPALTLSSTPTQSDKLDVSISDISDISHITVNLFDTENYVALTKAPEKTKSMNAMRELANNSARQAVHRSTRQRYLSASLLKLAICVIALTVAGALFAINGLSLNVGLIATLASLLVAAIWGYDGFAGLKPLLQSSLVLAPPKATELEETNE